MSRNSSGVDLAHLVLFGIAVAAISHAVQHRHHAYGGPGDGPGGPGTFGGGPRGRGFGRHMRGRRGLPPMMEARLRDWHRAEHEHDESTDAPSTPSAPADA